MQFPTVCLLLLVVPLLPTQRNWGIKIVVANDSSGGRSLRTTYLQEDRRREEYRNSLGLARRQIDGPRLALITRCDLGQRFELNLDSSEYQAAEYPPEPFTKEEAERRGIPDRLAYLSNKPTLRIEVKTTDTGERKEMFGRVARHVIITQTQTPLGGSRSEPQEEVTDGWYIDLDPLVSCERDLTRARHGQSYGRFFGGSEPLERPEFVTVGEPELGFALSSVTTTTGSYRLGDGAVKHTQSKMERRATEFEEGPLDPALFDIPTGFKQVDQIERFPPHG